MKKKVLLATMFMCAATLFSSVAMASPAKDLRKPVTIENHTTQEGVFKCTYPIITNAQDSKADTAINANIAEKIMLFTGPFNKTAKYGSPYPKIDAKIIHDKITGSVNYKLTCNANTIISLILDKSVTVPHKDGKSYTLDMKDGLNYTKDGTILRAVDWSNMAKAVNMEDPFSKACLKKSVDAALQARGLTAVKGYEDDLTMAKDNYYIDGSTNLHALYMPGMIAPESAGWFDVPLNMQLMK